MYRVYIYIYVSNPNLLQLESAAVFHVEHFQPFHPMPLSAERALFLVWSRSGRCRIFLPVEQWGYGCDMFPTIGWRFGFPKVTEVVGVSCQFSFFEHRIYRHQVQKVVRVPWRHRKSCSSIKHPTWQSLMSTVMLQVPVRSPSTPVHASFFTGGGQLFGGGFSCSLFAPFPRPRPLPRPFPLPFPSNFPRLFPSPLAVPLAGSAGSAGLQFRRHSGQRGYVRASCAGKSCKLETAPQWEGHLFKRLHESQAAASPAKWRGATHILGSADLLRCGKAIGADIAKAISWEVGFYRVFPPWQKQCHNHPIVQAFPGPKHSCFALGGATDSNFCWEIMKLLRYDLLSLSLSIFLQKKGQLFATNGIQPLLRLGHTMFQLLAWQGLRPWSVTTPPPLTLVAQWVEIRWDQHKRPAPASKQCLRK